MSRRTALFAACEALIALWSGAPGPVPSARGAAPKTAFTVKLTQAGGPPRWVSRAVYNDQTARVELSPDRGKAVGIPREFVGVVVGECMRYDDVEAVHVE